MGILFRGLWEERGFKALLLIRGSGYKGRGFAVPDRVFGGEDVDAVMENAAVFSDGHRDGRVADAQDDGLPLKG
jgi:hypothetical protein